MDIAKGSFSFVMWMRSMGVEIYMDGDAYVDNIGALLNPEMVKIERGGCVRREALLFGHVYEGDKGGMVKFGGIKIGEDGFVGSKVVIIPGVHVGNEANLSTLSLAMKGEIVRSR